MAANKFSNGMGYKHTENNGLPVHNIGFSVRHYNFKGIIQMAQIKWALILCDIFGIPVTMLGIAANMNNIKSTILFIIAAIYLMLRAYYYAIRQQQESRARDIDNWHKEQDKIDRINKNK